MMKKKADGHYRNRSIENNTKLINTRIRRGVFFSFQRVKTEFLFPIYTYIPFSDPIYFLLRNRAYRLVRSRSSCPEVFCKKGVLRNFAKFTGKHLCQRLFFKKEVFSCEFCEISKNTFFTERLRWLL